MHEKIKNQNSQSYNISKMYTLQTKERGLLTISTNLLTRCTSPRYKDTDGQMWCSPDNNVRLDSCCW